MKKKIILAGVLLALLTGCGQETSDKPEETSGQSEEVTTEETEDTDGEADEQGIGSESEQAGEEQTQISIYSIGEDGSLQTKQVAWTWGDYEAIWNELQASRILNEDSLLNACVVNEADKTITLDVNHGFGEFIRGFGTAGEQEILACVVNTYLEAYQYEGIKITEEQEVLMTGHRELDSYMGIQTL